MRFLLDENFPRAAADFLTERGHSVFDPRGTDLEGGADSELVEEAIRQRAVLLTTDRDFFHTLRHLYPEHCGLVVIALRQPNRAAILERLEWLLDNVPVDQLVGRAFQLRDHRWAVVPALPGQDRIDEQVSGGKGGWHR